MSMSLSYGRSSAAAPVLQWSFGPGFRSNTNTFLTFGESSLSGRFRCSEKGNREENDIKGGDFGRVCCFRADRRDPDRPLWYRQGQLSTVLGEWCGEGCGRSPHWEVLVWGWQHADSRELEVSWWMFKFRFCSSVRLLSLFICSSEPPINGSFYISNWGVSFWINWRLISILIGIVLIIDMFGFGQYNLKHPIQSRFSETSSSSTGSWPRCLIWPPHLETSRQWSLC